MLPILGQPIVERVMETIHANGIKDFILVVSPDDQDIVKYFNEESELEVNIAFAVQEERLGMANALQCAAPFIHQDFVLSACDNLASVEHVAELIKRQQKDEAIYATLSLTRIDPSSASKTGIVEMVDGRVTHIVEKPRPEEAPSNIASLPLYVFTPRILDHLPQVPLSPRGEYELQDAVQMLIEADGGVQGVFLENRLTLTGPDDLLVINQRLRPPPACPFHRGQQHPPDHPSANREGNGHRRGVRDRPPRLYRARMSHWVQRDHQGRGRAAGIGHRRRSNRGRSGGILVAIRFT
jgi:dTDP-glucose pyrophosphorylase